MKMKLLSAAIVLTLTSYTFSAEVEDDYYSDFYGSEELVEIATGIKTQIYQAPAVASVFTASQIKNMGATDIDDVLETVPGLHISRNAIGYNPIYSFRGVLSANNPQVLMLINGIPITNSFNSNRNQVWGGMSVEAISRIEVIRGPGSAVFGADAFSGVINIITKNADDIKQNEISIRGGENQTRDAWVTFRGEQKELKYSAVFEYHKTDGSNEIIDEDRQTFNDAIHGTSVSNAPGPVSRSAENIEFRSEVNYYDLTVRAGLQMRTRGIGIGLAEALDPTSRQESKRWNFDINYETQVSENFNITAQATYFDTTQEVKNDYIIFPAGYAGVFTDGLIGNPEAFERHNRLNLTGLYSGFNAHILRFGAGSHKADLYKIQESKNFAIGPDGQPIVPGSPVVDVTDTPYVYMPEVDRTNKYAFIQDVWHVANDWELTAGVRYDDYSDFGSTTNPRLALVWSTSLNLSTKLLYGKAFRAPSFVESSAINNPVSLGNPNIKPEKMETIELAFDYHPGNGLGLVWSFYNYQWDDIIQLVPDAGGNSSTAQNFGRQAGYGTEFELNFQVNEQLLLSGNYSWSKATNDLTDADVGYVPGEQVYIQADWKISDDIKLNFKNNFVQNRNRNVGDLRDDIDDYLISDLTLRWSPDKRPFELALIAKNIFDEDAREPSINNGEIVYLPNDLPLSGRSLLAELRYKF